MAKRNRGVNLAAESIGATLGRLSTRVDLWSRERHRLIAEIQHATTGMLHQLGHAGGTVVAALEQITGRATGRRPGFTMSAEARAKIAAAQKARWAKVKGQVAASSAGAASKATSKKKRNVSPEVRAKLARLAKARWAKAKKAGKSRLG